jgi:cytochrome c biogenesis protein CcmG/thiol:disulfide interchange protein DsbE|tara:strand:+ start:644 stop:1174 length:531 start_codon:yes stop_codon:yes gene_type:complete
MKKQILIIPSIFFLLLVSIFFYLLIIDRDPSSIPSNLINKNVPIFETKLLLKNKKFISSQEFGNGIVLVNFFATWCKPCLKEHSYIKKLSNEKNLRIVGINYKDDPKKTLEWLKNLGNPYSDIALDKNGRIAIDWGVYGIPETFIVSSDGKILYRHVGPITKNIYKKINLFIKNIK